MGAGGSMASRDSPTPDTPPKIRWLAALVAILGTGAWGVLTLAVGIPFYSLAIVGLAAKACAGTARTTARNWRNRLDWSIMVTGTAIAHVGVVTMLAGFALAFLFRDPIAGLLYLERGFWLAGLGGAGFVYWFAIDWSESAHLPTNPKTHTLLKRRWPAVLAAIIGTPVWGALSIPLVLWFDGANAMDAIEKRHRRVRSQIQGKEV
jgi:hypothetical protein